MISYWRWLCSLTSSVSTFLNGATAFREVVPSQNIEKDKGRGLGNLRFQTSATSTNQKDWRLVVLRQKFVMAQVTWAALYESGLCIWNTISNTSIFITLLHGDFVGHGRSSRCRKHQTPFFGRSNAPHWAERPTAPLCAKDLLHGAALPVGCTAQSWTGSHTPEGTC